MKLAYILFAIGLLLVSFLILVAIFFPELIDIIVGTPQTPTSSFSITSAGVAGGQGYIVFNYSGRVNLEFLALADRPKRDIYILREQGISITRLDEFIDRLNTLEDSGFDVNMVSPLADVRDGIYIIPSGAMPSSVFSRITHPSRNYDNLTIIFIGDTNLFIENELKQYNWYSELTDEQKKQFVIINSSLDETFEDSEKMESLISMVVHNSWLVQESHPFSFQSSGRGISTTAVIDMKNFSYMRIVAGTGGNTQVFDFGPFESIDPIEFSHAEVFPLEKFTFSFPVNRSNGTVILKKTLNGELIDKDTLGRVVEERVFLERISLEKPGYYILEASDNSGPLASGITNVKDVRIEHYNTFGNIHYFNVTVNGIPVDDERAVLSLNNSTNSMEFLISKGTLRVPAKLQKGMNTFNVRLFDRTYQVFVNNQSESMLDVYLKYGVPGLILICIIYIIARFSKRPVYILRVGNVGELSRKQVKMSIDNAKKSMMEGRRELNITGPITAQEFSIILKRKITDGFDITEGNVEELLKRMCSRGVFESYYGYYQLKGEGDVKANVLVRIIRENLIQRGIDFKFKDNKFITKDYELGVGGSKFTKKGVLVFYTEREVENYKDSLSPNEKAMLETRIFNKQLTIVTITRLDDVL